MAKSTNFTLASTITKEISHRLTSLCNSLPHRKVSSFFRVASSFFRVTLSIIAVLVVMGVTISYHGENVVKHLTSLNVVFDVNDFVEKESDGKKLLKVSRCNCSKMVYPSHSRLVLITFMLHYHNMT